MLKEFAWQDFHSKDIKVRRDTEILFYFAAHMLLWKSWIEDAICCQYM